MKTSTTKALALGWELPSGDSWWSHSGLTLLALGSKSQRSLKKEMLLLDDFIRFYADFTFVLIFDEFEILEYSLFYLEIIFIN